jgi:pimeloyl-ACP methyl ester carboxylesterase
MLEVIDKGSSSEAHPVPLLFVHGAYHAAWCWDENFLDYFADKGFRALAVSLRGHGQSTRCKPLRSCSIADYVEDVRAVADKLGCEPVPSRTPWAASSCRSTLRSTVPRLRS